MLDPRNILITKFTVVKLNNEAIKFLCILQYILQNIRSIRFIASKGKCILK